MCVCVCMRVCACVGVLCLQNEIQRRDMYGRIPEERRQRWRKPIGKRMIMPCEKYIQKFFVAFRFFHLKSLHGKRGSVTPPEKFLAGWWCVFGSDDQA